MRFADLPPKCRRGSGPCAVIRKAVPCLAFMALAFTSAAQVSGTLRLQIDPAGSFSYKLDHRFTMQQTQLELLEGAHHFSFWAPQRKVVDTTLTIVGNQAATFTLRLPFSTEYLVYQHALNAWRKDMRLMRTLPVALTGAALAYTAFKFADMKKAHDVLKDDRAAYDAAPSPHAITVLKERTIPADKEAFQQARNKFAVAAGVTVLFAGTTAWLYMRSVKKPKPAFHDAEKLRFEGLSWVPGPEGGSWQGGLTWHLAR